jgi:hypothetical protein
VAIGVLAAFAAKSNGIVTRRRIASESGRRRGEFASHGPYFASEVPNSSGLSAKKLESLPRFRSSGKPGGINPSEKSLDALVLF